MHYIERRVEERVDPRRVLEGARSIVSLGLVYSPGNGTGEADRCFGRSSQSGASGAIARYAGGDDYHEVMRDRMRALETGIAVLAGGPVRMRGYVDTGPVQERVFAAHAGLGWIGKNTCLIHPRLGSYVFLSALLTDLDLAPDDPEPDHCGTCRACLDACPTDAFAAAYQLDARRCIAYATIEVPDPIPLAQREAHGDRLFGCDICQEVCPWNQRREPGVPPDPLGLRERLHPRDEWARPSLAWILALDEDAWREATRHSALRRSRRRGLIRNALVAAGNSGDFSLRPLLEQHARGDDPLLAEHAEWALARLAESSEEL
jgi:epoxyqueuosine reductase